MSYLGVYDRTIFYNPASKYCIISVKTSDQSIPQQARSAYKHRDHLIRFVAVGYELPRIRRYLGGVRPDAAGCRCGGCDVRVCRPGPAPGEKTVSCGVFSQEKAGIFPGFFKK